MHRISQSDMPASRTAGFPRTAGFTIVEILVVVSIFTVLLTLLLPAVNNARESMRRTACTANQVRLVNAIARFSSVQGFMPSLSDRVEIVSAPGTYRATSWFGRLLPYMERNDIYNRLQGNIAVSVPLAEAICPSGLTTGRGMGWLCYGVNAGTTGFPWDGGIGLTVTIRRSLDDIREKDGLTNTFLTADKVGRTIGSHNDWEGWGNAGAGNLAFRNWNVGSMVGNPRKPIFNRMDFAQNKTPPRSGHTGGVVMTFFDGRAKFVNENIAPHIFGHLTTSYSVWTPSNSYSSGTGAVNSGTANYWLRASGAPPVAQEPLQLKETDY